MIMNIAINSNIIIIKKLTIIKVIIIFVIINKMYNTIMRFFSILKLYSSSITINIHLFYIIKQLNKKYSMKSLATNRLMENL